MAKLYTRSHIVIVRDDEEARNRNWVTDQEDYLVRNLGRGLWSVRAMDIDGELESECVDGAMLMGHCSVTALRTISEAMKIIFRKEEKFILLEARND